MNSRQLKSVSRDEEIFGIIVNYMLSSGGHAPSMRQIASEADKERVGHCKTSTATVSSSIMRLARLGLLIVTRHSKGDMQISPRGSKYSIDINMEKAGEEILKFHEELGNNRSAEK